MIAARYGGAVRRPQMHSGTERTGLDRLDLELIGALVADGRASYTSLGGGVGLSPAAARARVQRLLAERTVTVTARVDARTTGTAVIELALVSVTGPAEPVAQGLEALPEAVFVVCTTGPWGLVVELWCRDKDHLIATHDAVRAVPGVRDLESLPVREHVKQDWSGLAHELSEERTSSGQRTPTRPDQPLDDVDERIVDELMRNGRVSFAEIATRIDRSPAAIRARAQRLLDDDVVVVQTLVSQQVLGRGTFAGVLLSARGSASELAAELAELNETTLVAITSGRFEVACEVWSRNPLHLLRVLDAIRELPTVHRAECYPYLEITKEAYRVGPDAPA